jgi:magnesium transporter
MTYSNTALKNIDHMTQNSIHSISQDAAKILSGLDNIAAAELINQIDLDLAVRALRNISPDTADQIFAYISPDKQATILAALPNEVRNQWVLNRTFQEGSIGRMMEPAVAVFAPEMTVADTLDVLRDLVKREFVTYAYIRGADKKLVGVVVMRELLFAEKHQPLAEIMIPNPFSLKANAALMDAMKQVLTMHFPVYPVTNDAGELIGQVRGYRLFEAQAIEISAQAGSMVGVEKEEKLSTPWTRSFKYRHPWLQLNLLTAFVAGAVVSIFQDTIDQIVILATFLPVLAGQSGNTGCQALAVTLRAMTLGEFRNKGIKKLLLKEGVLGMLNGTFVGISAGLGMYILASSQSNPNAFALSAIVFVAMIGSCMISGLSGAMVPLVLKRIGADPATASSIFLTTATDVASMGMLLFLASRVLL